MDRLLHLSKSQILDLFRYLNGGSVGFDHERSKKSECIERLLAEYTEAQIIDAFAATASPVVGFTREETFPAPAVDQGAIAQQIAGLFAGLFATLAAGAVNEDRVRAIVDTAIADAVSRLVNRVSVQVADLPEVDCGVQHRMFPVLLRACSARMADGHRLNVWLRGPAGSGKTTAGKMVAKALSLRFVTNGAISQPFELLGFMGVQGTLVRTPFREAWEHGGVYLFDEVDSSNPNAVLAFNAALANGVCAFPDGMVERHPDCVVLAGANTSGNGATSDYVGRMKQDAAFLNRFVEIDWPVDEALESAIVPHTDWVRRVQGVRARVEQRGLKGHMVTPRASVYGAALLAAGIDWNTVEQMTLRKGLSDDAWTQIA